MTRYIDGDFPQNIKENLRVIINDQEQKVPEQESQVDVRTKNMSQLTKTDSKINTFHFNQSKTSSLAKHKTLRHPAANASASSKNESQSHHQ